jgi:predicted DCC family thiol-disulfide oxidoreductase YuxK
MISSGRTYMGCMASSIKDNPSRAIRIMYDGECPVCSSYVKFVRMRKAAGKVELLNMREHPEIVAAMRAKNIEVNEGMIVEVDGALYHGADAVHAMAMMSSPSNVANRINVAIFRHPWLATALYPAMKLGRNTLLKIIGRKMID